MIGTRLDNKERKLFIKIVKQYYTNKNKFIAKHS